MNLVFESMITNICACGRFVRNFSFMDYKLPNHDRRTPGNIWIFDIVYVLYEKEITFMGRESNGHLDLKGSINIQGSPYKLPDTLGAGGGVIWWSWFSTLLSPCDVEKRDQPTPFLKGTQTMACLLWSWRPTSALKLLLLLLQSCVVNLLICVQSEEGSRLHGVVPQTLRGEGGLAGQQKRWLVSCGVRLQMSTKDTV